MACLGLRGLRHFKRAVDCENGRDVFNLGNLFSTPSCYVTGVTAASVIVTWSEFRQSAPVLRVTT